MHMMPKENFNELVYSKTIPCISIYLPTHRSGKDVEQDPIRFKNLLREAKQGLTKIGIRAPEARKILDPEAGRVGILPVGEQEPAEGAE